MATETQALLPPHVTLLGQALTPALNRIEEQLTNRLAAFKPGGSVADFAETAQETLNQFGESADRLAGEVRRLDGLVTASAVADADVHRAVGRIEMVLDELLGSYAALRELRPDPEYADGHKLLAAALRHPLVEIRDWLRELVDVFADPATALEKRGLPDRGQVNLNLALTLTAPPEFKEFSRWLEGQTPPAERRDWDGLISLVVGFALGGLFFGGDE